MLTNELVELNSPSSITRGANQYQLTIISPPPARRALSPHTHYHTQQIAAQEESLPRCNMGLINLIKYSQAHFTGTEITITHKQAE